MIYFLIFVITFILFLLLLIYLRKFQYDKTHQTLLDLVEDIGGKVVRKSFAQQPMYVGDYLGSHIQITFSADKIESKRVDYITISYVISTPSLVSIFSKEWLKDMNADQSNSEDYTLEKKQYIIRAESKDSLANFDASIFLKIEKLTPFSYIIFSPNGGIQLDFITKNILEDIEKEKLLNKFKLLFDISKAIA